MKAKYDGEATRILYSLIIHYPFKHFVAVFCWCEQFLDFLTINFVADWFYMWKSFCPTEGGAIFHMAVLEQWNM